MAPLVDEDEERFKHGVSVRSVSAKHDPLSGDEAERRGVSGVLFHVVESLFKHLIHWWSAPVGIKAEQSLLNPNHSQLHNPTLTMSSEQQSLPTSITTTSSIQQPRFTSIRSRLFKPVSSLSRPPKSSNDQGNRSRASTGPKLVGQGLSHGPSQATINPELMAESLLSKVGKSKWAERKTIENQSPLKSLYKWSIKPSDAPDRWAKIRDSATSLQEATREVQASNLRTYKGLMTEESQVLLQQQHDAISALDDRSNGQPPYKAIRPDRFLHPSLLDSPVSDAFCVAHCDAILAHKCWAFGRTIDVETIRKFKEQMGLPVNRALLEQSINLVNGKSTAPVTVTGGSDVGDETGAGDSEGCWD
jgi:hypothetical protein